MHVPGPYCVRGERRLGCPLRSRYAWDHYDHPKIKVPLAVCGLFMEMSARPTIKHTKDMGKWRMGCHEGRARVGMWDPLCELFVAVEDRFGLNCYMRFCIFWHNF